MEEIKGGLIKEVYNALTLKKRYNYPPKVRKILETDGNRYITSIDVVRTPVSFLMTALLQGLSMGRFIDASKKEGFDKFFHLYLRLTLDNGRTVLVEKNEVINVEYNLKYTKEEQVLPVPMPGRVRFIDFLESARLSVGDEKFFVYDPFSTNCQNFVLNLLKSVGFLTPALQEFILQPADKLINRLGSRFHSIAKGVTDLAHTADVVLQGEGRYNASF